ncbi:S9 family peptidase [Aliikangiella coralliicola]|uniref:S9 family peptidase n=1 Tax=Aliikangiella coralliicola TaxID=2592383 RepID=A0A545UFQ4_9GAMM|nr:S9 family peptidase [Aliikangiella coralliicola]TQV88306.1 S9 family peptidase [Aliikangiella coralliicola]
MKDKLTSTLVAISMLASLAQAAPIERQKIQVLDSLEKSNAVTLTKNDFSKVVKQNLVHSISESLDSGQDISIFGDKKNWRSMDKIDEANPDAVRVFRIGMKTDRFTQGKLKIEGIEKTSVFVNGKSVSGNGSFDITLLNGDYRLLIMAQGIEDWKKVTFDWSSEAEQHSVTFSDDSGLVRLDPERLYDSETVSNLSLSPDGKQLLWTKRHYTSATADKAQAVTELVNPKSMEVLYRWQGMSPRASSWSEDNQYLAYTHENDIYLLNRENFQLNKVSEDLKGVNGLSWLDDSTLVLSWHKAEKKPHEFTKKYRALQDRWSYWRGNSQIYLLDISSGFIQQVTQNKLSSFLLDVDPKERRLLFYRSPVDYKKPPHSLSEVFELDLKTSTEKMIGKFRTFSNAAYSKDGIVFTAGPELKEGKGRNLAEGTVGNNYDGQLYLMKKDGSIKALSQKFNPAVGGFEVLKNGNLVLRTTDQDKNQLYYFNIKNNKFSKIKSAVEAVESFSVSNESKASIVFKGSSATRPQKVYLGKIGRSKKTLILDTAKVSYPNVKFAEMKDWDYTTQKGTTIDGRYYLPADFDSSKKYPAIIYYYGGTSPVGRAFTGRWPFSLWAAQGYVVYVLQPSGATGYGQKFSAKHVNAWGLETADDIIESTQAFVKAHSFVDGKRLGNMGASYGGFMTMYLATKTDLFRASISHAGISNLTSYWGYGWWGYGYSGVASHGSFPWNNSKLYVEQSPVFNADKVNTPLLLLHGDSDTNVPVGESHQMYTALKLLDKDVELIEFQGDDHHINARKHRLRWWETILSYFDKELKDQPEWWEHLYPEKK